MREKKGYLAQRGGGASLVCRLCWRYCGAVVPTAAPSGVTVSHCSATFFPVPCCAFVFSVPSRFLAFLPLSVGFSVSLFSVSVVFLSSFLSLVFSLFGFFLLPSSRVPFFLSPHSLSVIGSIYRAKRRGFLWLHMGSKGCGGWSAIWVQLSRFRSLFFG